MHLKWVNEKLAKAAIYVLAFLALAAFVLFVKGALAYRAFAEGAPPTGSGQPGEAVPAPQGRLSTSSAAYPPAKQAGDTAGGAAQRQTRNVWQPGIASEKFPLLPGVDAPQPSADSLAAEKQRLRDMAVGFPDLTTADYAGEFHNTAYCCEVYPHICGGNGITASGTIPTPGLTCAADWEVFPPGTWLYIEDVGIRRVEDSGSAIIGQRLDIAVDTHRNALAWAGFGAHNVWVLAWPEAQNM